jgi:DNA repair exonuclease SbcCD ATPase subunit
MKLEVIRDIVKTRIPSIQSNIKSAKLVHDGVRKNKEELENKVRLQLEYYMKDFLPEGEAPKSEEKLKAFIQRISDEQPEFATAQKMLKAELKREKMYLAFLEAEKEKLENMQMNLNKLLIELSHSVSAVMMNEITESLGIAIVPAPSATGAGSDRVTPAIDTEHYNSLVEKNQA